MPVELMCAFGDNWQKFLKFVLQLGDATYAVQYRAVAVVVAVLNDLRRFEFSGRRLFSNQVNVLNFTEKCLI